jgi:glycosyltransferase involved in cell wall biosynthesis
MDAEVIVVPNGPDRSWVDSLRGLSKDPRVRVMPVERAGANGARNHGLMNSRGGFVRFLDDDDYLIESGARNQYEAMLRTDAHICSGGVEFVDDKGRRFDVYLPKGNDLVFEVFEARASTLPVSHLYRREFLRGVEWSVNRQYLQDVAWMHSLMCRGEVHWQPVPDIVGAWVHHRDDRLSVSFAEINPSAARIMACDVVMKSICELEVAGRLGGERAQAAAKALWDYIPGGFIFAPFYWSAAARKALRLNPRSRPNEFFYHRGLWRMLDPLVAEWIWLVPRVIRASIGAAFRRRVGG